jgi:hypothetical protein
VIPSLYFDTPDTLRAAIDDPATDRAELHARLVEFGKRLGRRDSQPQVDALLAAGWQFILPEHDPDPEPFQWFWRRPGKRPGRPGRLFRSTGQAYNALMRERG